MEKIGRYNRNHNPGTVCALACLLFIFSACGNVEDQKGGQPSNDVRETDTEAGGYQSESDTENGMAEDDIAEDDMEEDDTGETLSAENEGVTENLREIPIEENGILEIHAEGEAVSISDDIMIAQVSPQEVLIGNPILYDRFRIDGWVFEWLISDHEDEESDGWLEDGVLVISREGDAEEVQVIHVEAEGGGGATWVSAEHKFEYVDVNFDTIPDLLICTGHHGAQGLLTYYCFLQREDGFTESPTFTDIPNPAIDADNQLILGKWRNWACSYSWAEFAYQDHAYVLVRELREELELGDSSAEDVSIWTVNGEVIGRSDELSEAEIDDLIYNENSEWGISQGRWRMIYMTADHGIYSRP